jgi:hypothetical protein
VAEKDGLDLVVLGDVESGLAARALSAASAPSDSSFATALSRPLLLA